MTCPTAIFDKVLPIFLLSLLMILKMFLPVNQEILLQQSRKLKKMFPQANFILEQTTMNQLKMQTKIMIIHYMTSGCFHCYQMMVDNPVYQSQMLST